MTEDEFWAQYAERSGVTADWLRQRRVVLPCRCGEPGCMGWQMLPPNVAADPLVRRVAGIE